MFNGLRIGTTGMKTAQRVMDNVADQIANSETNGYKKKEVNFSELLRNEIGSNQVELSQNAENAAIGAGSRAVISKTNFNQGMITESEGVYHMAIEGNGYFGVTDPQGNLMLTRNGAFQKNGDQSITDEEGNLLSMETYLPQTQWGDSQFISISSEGLISGRTSEGQVQNLGRVMLYQVESQDQLVSLGEGKYMAGNNIPLYNSADDPGRAYGNVRQRALEKSNADIVQSMTDMIITQRAYQVNAKSVTTADEMLEVINTIV